MTLAGFPHSGTPGSTPTCGSPRLFAACRALLRLSVPRHPPCALVSLDRIALAHPASLRRGLKPPVHRLPGTTHTLGALAPLSTLSLLTPNPTTRVFKSQSEVEECHPSASTCELAFCPLGLTRGSRKEVIQPQVPLRLPCYDFAPVTELAFGGSLPCGLGHRLRALPTPMA
jgi:hypothetical protein